MTTLSTFTQTTYEDIAKDIIYLYDSYRDIYKSAELARCMIRLAGHDTLDYYRGQYGSDGCLDFQNPINVGLADCIRSTGIVAVYETRCDEVSLADFIVIAAEAMMYRLSTDYDSRNLFTFGQLGRVFRDNFKAGRTAQASCEDRMPNPANGCGAVEEYLVHNVFA